MTNFVCRIHQEKGLIGAICSTRLLPEGNLLNDTTGRTTSCTLSAMSPVKRRPPLPRQFQVVFRIPSETHESTNPSIQIILNFTAHCYTASQPVNSLNSSLGLATQILVRSCFALFRLQNHSVCGNIYLAPSFSVLCSLHGAPLTCATACTPLSVRPDRDQDTFRGFPKLSLLIVPARYSASSSSASTV